MSIGVPKLKRRGSITAYGVSQGGGGGEDYLEAVTASRLVRAIAV